jgi:GT2 family glycosyltransferase
MDTIVTPGWLRDPIAFLEIRPEVGAVSPLLVLNHDVDVVNAIGQDIHVTALGFNRGLGQSRAQVGLWPVPVSGIHGAAFVIRRAILDRIGGLDETGFLYHEDVDISWLLHIMGYDLYCIPTSVVRHKYFLTMYPEKLYLLERNRVTMLLAHLETHSLLWMAPLLLATEGLMWGYCLLRGAEFLQAKAAAYRWVLKQRRCIAGRRALVRRLRRRSDWQVLKRLPWNYAWDQFLTLGRERGRSRRQPAGGLPVGQRQAPGSGGD